MIVDSSPSFVLVGGSENDSNNGASSSGLTCEKSAANDITPQIATTYHAGVASSRCLNSCETNPKARERHRNRLIKKLQRTIDEYTKCFGQQAVVIIAAPDPPKYKVYGAMPLKNVMKDLRRIIMEELECALAQQPFSSDENSQGLFELPSFRFDGIETPVEKLTQAQLRAFIPHMLKFSTGRGKPGWNIQSKRPPWWPEDVPWSNLRKDVRSDADKQKMTWTDALRQIVINCYKYHEREDLLPSMVTTTAQENSNGTMNLNNPTITLSDGTILQVHGLSTIQMSEQTDSQIEVINVNLAALKPDGQIIFLTEDGQPASVNGVVTVPVNTINDGTQQIIIQGPGNDPPQVLQLL